MSNYTVKFISETDNTIKVAGYGIVFNTTDLVGDTFTKDTELGFKRNPMGMPVYYGHNLETVKGTIGSVTDYDIDDIGVWFEMELDKSNKYLSGIQKLVSQKRVGLSTGALSHTIDKDTNGNIKSWTVGEISLTVTPAESKTVGIEFKKDYSTKMESENQMSDKPVFVDGKEVTGNDTRMNTLEMSLKEYSTKVEQLISLWENTKDVKTGKVAGGSKENESVSFGGWLKAVTQGDEERINEVYAAHPANAIKVLNSSGGEEGGYLIPQQFVNNLITLMSRTQIVRPRSSLQPIPFGNVTIPGIKYDQAWSEGADPNLGGLQMFWTAEGATDTQSEPEFRQIELRSNEATTSIPVTNKLLDNNAIGLEAVMMRLFSEVVGYTEDYAYIRGDGVGKPIGVLNTPATVSVDVTAAGPTVAEYSAMYTRLAPECEGTAVWVIHPLLFDDLMALNADTTAALTFLPDINGRITPLLYGMPVLRSKIMPRTYALGGLMLVDFQKYIIGDDLNIEIAMSPHAAFRKRQTLYRVTIRTDGQPMFDVPIPVGSGGDDNVTYCVKSSVA